MCAHYTLVLLPLPPLPTTWPSGDISRGTKSGVPLPGSCPRASPVLAAASDPKLKLRFCPAQVHSGGHLDPFSIWEAREQLA